ncbi:MAG: translation initiation factor IF-3 [Gemmatimonadetes bacterium]|nr:translation initiation factor IF-3 [Gemmatimonadota bacterium]
MQEVTGSSPVSPTIPVPVCRPEFPPAQREGASVAGLPHGRSWKPQEGGSIIEKELRVNDKIRISPIRVVSEDGEQLGIMTADEGRALARERGLDLVEVAATSRPPVCRIMDFGKFKYEQNKKDRKAKSRQHGQQLKEVKFRPKIEKHDLEVKVRNARRFLEEHHKVKVTMNFRGREVTHSEIGRDILKRVAALLEDVSQVESPPRIEGRHMIMLLSPKSAAGGQKKQPKGDKPKADKPKSDKPKSDKPKAEKSEPAKPETKPEEATPSSNES